MISIIGRCRQTLFQYQSYSSKRSAYRNIRNNERDPTEDQYGICGRIMETKNRLPACMICY